MAAAVPLNTTPVSLTVAWGGFESSKLFPSHLICSSSQQRQLTMDKHYLHNARRTRDHNKRRRRLTSSFFPSPTSSVPAVARSAVWKQDWRSDGGNNKLRGFDGTGGDPAAGR